MSVQWPSGGCLWLASGRFLSDTASARAIGMMGVLHMSLVSDLDACVYESVPSIHFDLDGVCAEHVIIIV